CEQGVWTAEYTQCPAASCSRTGSTYYQTTQSVCADNEGCSAQETSSCGKYSCNSVTKSCHTSCSNTAQCNTAGMVPYLCNGSTCNPPPPPSSNNSCPSRTEFVEYGNGCPDTDANGGCHSWCVNGVGDFAQAGCTGTSGTCSPYTQNGVEASGHYNCTCHYGGGNKVICTELHRQGYLSFDDMMASTQFSKERIDAATRLGYHYWAEPLVRVMERSPAMTDLLKPIGLAWGKHMSFVMGIGQEDDAVGKAISDFGIAESQVLGLWLQHHKRTEARMDEDKIAAIAVKYLSGLFASEDPQVIKEEIERQVPLFYQDIRASLQEIQALKLP
ncbi:MAG: hypothetical protein QGI45_01990, partial [Myxococcota bacterium]|nr:hypothetical protein [Myxococcota bacterium]